MLPDLRFDFAGVRVRGLVRRGVPNHFVLLRVLMASSRPDAFDDVRRPNRFSVCAVARSLVRHSDSRDRRYCPTVDVPI